MEQIKLTISNAERLRDDCEDDQDSGSNLNDNEEDVIEFNSRVGHKKKQVQGESLQPLPTTSGHTDVCGARLLSNQGKENQSYIRLDSSISGNNSGSGSSNNNLDNSTNASSHNEVFCFECQNPLTRSRHLINISGQAHKWHSECFKCQMCNKQLDREESCHLIKDKIICRQDYIKLRKDFEGIKLTDIKCPRCKWSISPLDWIRRAGNYVYHLACFSCDICLRQLSTGEQFTLNLSSENTVRLLCKSHFAIINNNETNDCSLLNTSETTTDMGVTRNGQTNNRITGARTACESANNLHRAIPGTENLFKGICPDLNSATGLRPNSNSQYVHMPTCSTSGHRSKPAQENCNEFVRSQALNRLLNRGEDQFSDELNTNGQYLQENSTSLAAAQHLAAAYGIASDLMKDRPDRMKNSPSNSSISSNSSSVSTTGAQQLMSVVVGSKSKRVRTTFTEDQLSILQSHFQIDSNPDGQDLERIATITGLSKRVTQVWFQNSRARQKKYKINISK